MTEKNVSGRSKLIQLAMLNERLDSVVEDRFDLIFSDGLFEHFDEAEQYRIMQNFLAVLAGDGKIVTFVPNRWSPWQIIRPWFMPGIEEKPFCLSGLVNMHKRNGLRVFQSGGINVLPFGISPEFLFSKYFGMLLYVVAGQDEQEEP